MRPFRLLTSISSDAVAAGGRLIARVGDHFYTTQFDELGFGQYGWTFERVECYVSP